jgi:hypothetical protein
METERENYAQDAINNFVQYSCVFLIPGQPHQIATEVGSGIIIQTEKKHIAVLTAKHIAKKTKSEEYRLGYFKCSHPISDFVYGIMLFPDNIDVGIIIVKPSHTQQILHLTVDHRVVSVVDHTLISQDILILNGFPSDSSSYNQNTNKQGFMVLSYECVPENISSDEKGRYQLDWKDAIASKDGQTFNLPSPEGMSGGPLWHFQKPNRTSFWYPQKIGKIIGIQSAWDCKHKTIIEPANKWSNWFYHCIKEIDQAL